MDTMNCMPNQIVFVPACLLCPAYQAHSKKNTVAWACQWRSFLSENNLGVVQMPCPEASFDSVECGLGRKPHGITFYGLFCVLSVTCAKDCESCPELLSARVSYIGSCRD